MLRIVVFAGTLVALAGLSLPSADAKCTIGLGTLPRDIEWSEPLKLRSDCWFDSAWLSARYVDERPEGRFVLDPEAIVVEGRGTPGSVIAWQGDVGELRHTLRLGKVPGAPLEPQPGWLEIATGFEGPGMMYRYTIAVTRNSTRPADSSYITGQVRGIEDERSLGISVVVWAPLDDPDAYKFTYASRTEPYETGFLSPGDWFVSYYETSDQTRAVGSDLTTVTRYSKELGRDVTLSGRIVHVPDSRPVSGIDFRMERLPRPPITFPTWTPTTAPNVSMLTHPWLRQSEGDDHSDWLGSGLLAVGAAVLGCIVAVTRRRA